MHTFDKMTTLSLPEQAKAEAEASWPQEGDFMLLSVRLLKQSLCGWRTMQTMAKQGSTLKVKSWFTARLQRVTLCQSALSNVAHYLVVSQARNQATSAVELLYSTHMAHPPIMQAWDDADRWQYDQLCQLLQH
jgi:hypothetical protein